jgi:hypothetical protein
MVEKIEELTYQMIWNSIIDVQAEFYEEAIDTLNLILYYGYVD